MGAFKQVQKPVEIPAIPVLSPHNIPKLDIEIFGLNLRQPLTIKSKDPSKEPTKDEIARYMEQVNLKDKYHAEVYNTVISYIKEKHPNSIQLNRNRNYEGTITFTEKELNELQWKIHLIFKSETTFAAKEVEQYFQSELNMAATKPSLYGLPPRNPKFGE